MKTIESIATENRCYTAGRKITVKGLMLHSVGCPQPSAKVFVDTWDKETAGVCPHGVIDGDTGDVYQTLPWDCRGWHCASGSKGSGNDTHIGIEMAEPSCIKYACGSNFTCSDTAKAREAVKRTYDSAVELFAMLCGKYGLNPLADGVIISHKEGCMRGIASAHEDPEHLWKQLETGYTMDGFRKDVAAKMGRSQAPEFELDRSYHVTQDCYLRTSPGTGSNKISYMALSDTLKGKCWAKAGQAVFRKGERFRLTKTKCAGADVWGRMKSGYWIPLVYNGKVRVK